MYFTLLYSDLGLGRLTGKQRSLVAKYAVDVNLFRLGCQFKSMRDQGAQPRQGVRRGEATRPKKKSIISQKLIIAQKKSLVQKMGARSIPKYSTNLVTFEKSWIFGAPYGHLWHPNVMWWNFTPIIFLSRLRIFYVDMATFEGGLGLHIRSWETTNNRRLYKINREDVYVSVNLWNFKNFKTNLLTLTYVSVNLWN